MTPKIFFFATQRWGVLSVRLRYRIRAQPYTITNSFASASPMLFLNDLISATAFRPFLKLSNFVLAKHIVFGWDCVATWLWKDSSQNCKYQDHLLFTVLPQLPCLFLLQCLTVNVLGLEFVRKLGRACENTSSSRLPKRQDLSTRFLSSC